MFGNGMAGRTQGAEVWANYEVARWWRVSLGGNILREYLHFAPGSGGLGGIQQAGSDPGHQFALRSSMGFSHGITFETGLRQIGSLPDPAVPAYTEVDAHLSWAVSPPVAPAHGDPPRARPPRRVRQDRAQLPARCPLAVRVAP